MSSTSAELPIASSEEPARHSLRRGDLALPLIAVTAISVGLWLDANFGMTGHVLANLFVLGCFFAVRRFATAEERHEQWLCVVLATLGECFLCFGWGLYEYRHQNLPVFVPLGHSLIFLAGLRLTRFAPAWSAQVVVPVAAIAVATLAALGQDRLGLVLLPLFLGCLLLAGQRKLYAVMFVVSYAVEIAGTAVESWAWLPADPWFGLPLTNPPVCAGTFYCVLDLLVLVAVRIRRRMRGLGAVGRSHFAN